MIKTMRAVFVFVAAVGAAATLPAQEPVRQLQDLIGARGSDGEYQMERRGYTYVSTQKDMDNSYTFWREDRTGQCVSVRTWDGRYQAIVYVPQSDCSGSSGSDRPGYGDPSYGGGGYVEGGGVTLYRDLNFGGTSERFTSDVPDLRGSRIGNDQATSVRVDRGCTVQLFTDINYRGASIDLTSDESDLRSSRIGNDNISSMRVRCGGAAGGGYGDDWDVHSPAYGVTLYRDVNFGGTSETFNGDVPDLRGSRIGNDQATSVRVSPGCRARLYRDVNFGGAYTEVNGDANDLRGSTVGNDSVTSIRVRCDR